MAVLKHTSPTALPSAPRPNPSSTVPSASTRRAVGTGSGQPLSACFVFMSGLHSGEPGGRQSRGIRGPIVLREKLTEATKEALKSGDKLKLSTLRLMTAAVQNGDIEARTAGRKPLSDEELLRILQKQIHERNESVELYEKRGSTG